MSKLFIIVERKEDWTSYYPSEDVGETIGAAVGVRGQGLVQGAVEVHTTSTCAMATTARCSPRRAGTR